jgi:integrase
LASILADPECGPTWTLAVRACLRCGELAWLTADDVLCGPDGNPAAVHIRAKTCPFTGEGWQPKGGHERTVPLAAEAAEVVRACLADVAARRDSRARWLFVNPDARAGRGGRWMRNALTARLNRRLAACGIAGGHLHTLRHTGITAWAVAGMPQPQLQRLAGHRDGQTTAVYIHARDQDVADSLRAIEASGRLASLVAAGVSAARTAA